MKFLLVHQHFPGQYLHIARHLASFPGNEVVFITQRKDNVTIPGVRKIIYEPVMQSVKMAHPYLSDMEAHVRNAQAVARIGIGLRKEGFVPNIMLGHNGWGEIWYLKDIFPNVPLIGYFEFFYRAEGADVGFDKSFPINVDTAPRVRTKNSGNFIGLDACDWGQCPTVWQRSTYPSLHHQNLKVVHEGIDTNRIKPDDKAVFCIPGTEMRLSKDDEVLTYVSRNLEPYRGFPSLMKSLPKILQTRPKAHVLVVGGDDTAYGPKAPNGLTFKEILLKEVGDSIDLKRVHFLGKVPYESFLKIIQVSRVHLYLTYPFVLSWSVLEAMAAECLIVASDTAPVRDVIIDGENGLLVDFFSVDEIADKVSTALEYKDSFPMLRTNARKTIRNEYDLYDKCLPTFLSLLKASL